VSATPVTPTASPKSSACLRPFWPVVASRTSSVSCGAPCDHAPHLGQLLHQVRLRVQAAGRIHDDDVAPAGLRRRDRVEGHGGRVGATLRAHEVGARALGPDLELLFGGGAKRVRGGQHDRASRLPEAMRELADRRRLAGAVDPDDEDDGRRAA